MLERDWQAQVVDLARLTGWMVQHSRVSQVGARWVTAITGDVGFPDLVLAHPVRGAIFAELKAPRGRLSPAQERWGSVLSDGGAHYYVWRPEDVAVVTRVLTRGPMEVTR